MTSPKRPIMRYHGGKWRLAKWILSHFPEHRIYVELFGGAASVLLQKERCYSEVYNDLDREVVNLFRVLRDKSMAKKLKSLLALTPYAKDEFTLSYEPVNDPVEQARRTVFRSFSGFGSGAACGHKTGFRACSNRSNTPPAHDWRNYPGTLQHTVERLRGVVVENKPALDVIKQHDSAETLFYADPPYPHSTRMRNAGYSGVYRHEMSDQDHQDLAERLHKVDGFVVVSGYPCDLYDQILYPTWTRVERDARADCALERTEVLWINPAASEEIQRKKEKQLDLFRQDRAS